MRPIAMVVVFLLCPLAGATIVAHWTGMNLRELIKRDITQGKDPILLRLQAMRDPGMAKAIRLGAKQRPVRVLADETSPELEGLAKTGLLNLEIRIAEKSRRGLFRGSRLTHSFCMQAGDSYTTVYADAVWQPSALRGEAVEVLESGKAFWEESPREAAAFRWEFDRALPIEWNSLHGAVARPMPLPARLDPERERVMRWLRSGSDRPKGKKARR